MRKRGVFTALLLMLAVLLYGCGAGSSNLGTSGSMADRGGSTATAPGAGSPPVAPAEALAPGPVSVADQAGDPVAGVTAQVTERKIIQNAEVELNVKDVDDALSAINDAVRSSGGYVQESRVSGTRERGRRVVMTLRVPAGSYGSILDLLNGLGEQINLRQWTNDVTEEYLDLEARIETGEAHLAQLNRLYERSGTVTEMIELEREIARVTADLESLKGRYNFLANQVAFSTISVNLYEPGVPTPSRAPLTLGERMRDAFLFSWNNTIAAAESLLVALVALIPALLFLAVLVGIVGGVIWMIVRSRRGRSGPGGGGPGGRGSAGGGGRGTGAGPGGGGGGGRTDDSGSRSGED